MARRKLKRCPMEVPSSPPPPVLVPSIVYKYHTTSGCKTYDTPHTWKRILTTDGDCIVCNWEFYDEMTHKFLDKNMEIPETTINITAMPPLFTPKRGSHGVPEAVKEVAEALGDLADEEKVHIDAYAFAAEVTGLCIAWVEELHQFYLKRKEIKYFSFAKVDLPCLTPFLEAEYQQIRAGGVTV